LLACADFDFYVITNRIANRDRAPSNTRYVQIFGEEDLAPGGKITVTEAVV
jgi:hypothetical protein